MYFKIFMYIYAYQVFDTFITAPAFIVKVAGSEQALNHTMLDLCEIFNFHENDYEYISSGM